MSALIDVKKAESRRTDGTCNGFSLVEMTIAMAILLVVSVFVLSSFSGGIRSMSREKSVAERDVSIKRAFELMAIEIGHAGVVPDLLDPDSPTVGPKIAADIGAGTTAVSVQGPFKGFYPGRPIVLGLPDNDSLLSETVKLADVDATGKLLTLASATTLAHQSATNGAITSPMLPNPFGILNPPPSLPIAGPPFQKGPLSRIGFVGDIYGDGSMQYVEYVFANGALTRSNTPISESTKRPAEVLLDNVTEGGFTIIYAKKTIPIAAAVRITITVRNTAPEPRVTGGAVGPNTFNSVSMFTEVKTHGTASAALIWEKGGEKQLRNMLPPCAGVAPGTGFPPCSNWSGVQWWRNAATFAAGLP